MTETVNESKDLKDIKRKIVKELINEGKSYKEIAAFLKKIGFYNATESSVKHIDRDMQTVRLFRKHRSFKDISIELERLGFGKVSENSVRYMLNTYCENKEYQNKAPQENLPERNRIVLNGKAKGLNYHEINDLLVNSGFRALTRQRIAQII